MMELILIIIINWYLEYMSQNNIWLGNLASTG